MGKSQKRRVFDDATFIERAREVHGQKYDYSLVEYRSTSDKIKIKCLLHGIFEQTPNSHLRGSDCPVCGRILAINNMRLDPSLFFQKAKEIHGDKYDYSLVVYKDIGTKITVRCLKHGIFSQRPSKHISGQGCPRCARELKKYNALTTETFVAKAKEVHGNRYDYSLSDYKKSCIKVKIKCPEHGVFEQTPNNHLMGMKCERCALEENATKRRSSTQEFVSKAKRVQGDKYDYSSVNYVGCSVKVKITCPEHGIFLQIPSAHLAGRGCPWCEESRGERKIATFLDSHGIGYEREKTFELCRNSHKLPFDFYIPSLNTCIEYDGRQHYFPSKYFGGVPAFERLKKTDLIKNDFCSSNGIRLFRIPYRKKSSEAIASVLKSLLLV